MDLDAATLGWGTAAFVAVVTGGLLAAAAGRVRGAGERLADERARTADARVRDDVTGCLNRRGLELVGGYVAATARRRGDSLHAVLVEVTGLDVVLERHGPAGRDDVLTAVGTALRRVTREADVAARVSASAFVVLTATGSTAPAELERRLRAELGLAPPVPRKDWPMLLTAGAAVLEPWDSGHLDDLLALAEQDLGLRRALRAPSRL